MRILIALLCLSACASTVHERCSKPKVAARYRDYDQCYSEEAMKREHRHHAWHSFAQNLQQQPNKKTSFTCHAVGNSQSCQED